MSELSKQAGVLTATEFFRFFIKTVIGIVLARLLTPAELGSYRQLFLVYTTLSAVLLLGIPQSLLYFLPKASNPSEQRRIIRRTLNLIGLLSILCAAAIFIGKDIVANKFDNPLLKKLLFLFALYPLFMFVTQIFSSIMLGLKEPVKAASFTLFSILCDLVLILGTAVLTKNLNTIVIAVLVSAFMQYLYAWFKLYKYSRLNFEFDFGGLKSQLVYSVPLGLSSLVGMLSIQLDKIMVSGFFTPEQFAVFSVGAMELPLIGILANSVNSVILPNLSSGDKSQMGSLYSAAVRKNSLIVFPLAALFFLLADPLMVFLYGKPYAGAAVYFRIYLYALPLRVATYGILFQAMGKTKVIMLNSVLSLFTNVCLNYVLIRQIGMRGAALATVLVTWLSVGLYLWHIKYVLKFSLAEFFPFMKMAKNFGVSVLSALFTYPIFLLKLSVFANLVLIVIIYCFVFIFLGIYSGVILEYDIQVAKQFMRESTNKLILKLMKNTTHPHMNI